MRTFAGPAMLAAHGRISGQARIAVLIAASGELAADKTPAATDRTDAPAVVGRVLAGAYTGHRIADAPGTAAGAVAAAVGSYATWRVRKLVVDTTGLPDPVVAVGEDVLAMAAAAVATRPDPEPSHDADSVNPAVSTDPADPKDAEPGSPTLVRRAAIGLSAGVVGTAAMTLAQGAGFVLTDDSPSYAPAEIADTLKRRAGKGRLKRSQRRVANQAMHWLYGISWGVPYGLVAAGSDVAPEVSGPIFGLLVWGAALAHEPALGLADVPWKRSLQSLGSEALLHLVYGIGAGAALRTVRSS